MICYLFGLVEGRRYDVFMLVESGLLLKLERRLNKLNGEFYVIYGDFVYLVRWYILVLFRGVRLILDEECFNKDMSIVRISVEWGYGKIVRYFVFFDFNKNFKVFL